MAEPSERDREIYRDAYARFVASSGSDPRSRQDHRTITFRAIAAAEAEGRRKAIENPEIESFLDGVRVEAAHQVKRWGEAHDRGKSAENWFWLIGYLAGKALRSSIDGARDKALHHTISSAAALFNWHQAIKADSTNHGLGDDRDLEEIARFDADTCADGWRRAREACAALLERYTVIRAQAGMSAVENMNFLLKNMAAEVRALAEPPDRRP